MYCVEPTLFLNPCLPVCVPSEKRPCVEYELASNSEHHKSKMSGKVYFVSEYTKFRNSFLWSYIFGHRGLKVIFIAFTDLFLTKLIRNSGIHYFFHVFQYAFQIQITRNGYFKNYLKFLTFQLLHFVLHCYGSMGVLGIEQHIKVIRNNVIIIFW
jgi:hypothetical protein